MRYYLLPLILLMAVACKPRDPDSGGLFAADAENDEVRVPIAKGGDWNVHCQSTETDSGLRSYEFRVEGAVNNGDEAQELLVSVSKTQDGKTQDLVVKNLGHGAVSEAGPLFVGFTSGVLTADAATVDGKVVYTGVLTLTPDHTEGLKVQCSVERAKQTASEGL